MNRTMFIKHYLLALLVFNLSACSSMQTVSVENAVRGSQPRGVERGSLVEVKTFDRKAATFRVTRINAEGLGSSNDFYRYEDMASLKVERPESHDSNTANIILGILGVVALGFLIANADEVKACGGTHCDYPD